MGGILRRLFPGWRADPPRPNGYLTWAEIEAKYPGQWVLVDFADQPRTSEVPGGWVIAHGPDRAAVSAALDHAPEVTFFTVRYTDRAAVAAAAPAADVGE